MIKVVNLKKSYGDFSLNMSMEIPNAQKKDIRILLGRKRTLALAVIAGIIFLGSVVIIKFFAKTQIDIQPISRYPLSLNPPTLEEVKQIWLLRKRPLRYSHELFA